MRLLLAQPALRCLRYSRISQASCVRHFATPVESKPRKKDFLLGDYPQLPDVSTQVRPAEGWWDPQMRRNYGEPVHEQDEAYNMWSPDPPPIGPSKALFQLTLAGLGIAAFGFYVYHHVPERTAIPRQYPYSGLVKELGGVEANRANPELEDAEDDG